MDAFRLLTRSTKFKPGAKSGPSSIPNRLPSAGEASTPQLFPDEPSNRGTKRKRNNGESSSFLKDAPILNSEPRSPPAADALRKRKRNTGKDIEQGDGDISDQPITEDECKSILKTHKIKVTNLSNPPISAIDKPVVGKKSKSKRKRAEAAAIPLSRKQQKAAQRIYPEPLTSFDKLKSRYRISRRLLDNIANQGYTVPTEVQLGSLPLLLGSAAVRNLRANGAPEQDPDLLVVAPTGSGKTLAFMIPLISKVLKHHHDNPGVKEIFAVVIAPTKELVAQIVNEGRKLSAGTAVKTAAMRKGMRVVEERGRDRKYPKDEGEDTETEDTDSASSEAENQSKPASNDIPLTKSDILVCTPLVLANALSDHGKKEIAPLPSVRSLVLDEADVLLDPLFRDQTLDVWKACTCPQLRIGLWSATMGSNIEELTKSTMKEREQSLGLDNQSTLIRLVVGLKDTAVPNISHKLVYAATERGKLLGLRQLLHPTASSGSTTRLCPPFLVFTQTIARATALHSELMYDIPLEAGGSSRIAVLHSELSDSKRSDVMAGFRKGEIWILITTDLLSRGVDFRGINGVVNYDIPNSSAAYVHRVGRTGRAGREGGVAVTFYTKEDIPYVKNIANVISASEKLREEEGGECIPQWLIDALPSLSKKDKKDLKKHGVKARRPSALSDKTSSKKMRISTKSGFDRKMENRRKGAIRGNQRRKETGPSTEAEEAYEAWGGIDD